MPPIDPIIIVGAGPAGLLLALLIAKAGVRNITLLERDARPTDETRAVFYQPVAKYEFERAGILEDVHNEAFHPQSACFRDAENGGKPLFSMVDPSTTALPLNKLAAIIQRHTTRYSSNIQLLYSHEVTALGQDESTAWVDVQTPTGQKRFEGKYVIGCDGGKSFIRQSLFGEAAMPGFTWDKNLAALDIIYDLHANLPETADSNIFLHPQNAWLAFRPDHEVNHWRLICRFEGEPQGPELEAALKSILPGQPDPDRYTITRARSYKIHQRIVDNMRVGRVVLASDAAHLCCPYGALGLNGGIADIGSLYDCLMAIHEGKADDSILDVYSTVRRDKWKTIIDPTSQGTLRMIFSDPTDVVPNHPAYRMSRLMKTDPEAARQRAPSPLALRYDFSNHFKMTQ